jgi:energy-coupling factor transporter ATP-binding protein EcfA2
MFTLKKLIVKNFKAFHNMTLHIDSNNLSLLDGPNGFGKTSFYDALELLFLGKVQRYLDIEDKAAEGRKSAKKYPLMFNGASTTDELVIELTVNLDNGDDVVLKRSASCSDLMALKQIQEASFNFQVFINSEPIKFDNEEKILTHLLGSNYQRNYGLFHYIEQEENTALLKSKSTHKQEKIDHLFDVSDYRDKIKKIEILRDTIKPLKTPKKKTYVDNLKKQFELLEKEIIPSGEQKEKYKRLVTCSEQPWDNEKVLFSSGSYSNWLGEGGELHLLSELKTIEEDLNAKQFNNALKKELYHQNKAISILLRYGKNIPNIPAFKEQISLFEKVQTILELTQKGSLYVIENKIFPEKEVASLVAEVVDLEEMKTKSAEIRNQLNSNNQLSTSLNKVVASRDKYLSDYNQHLSSQSSDESICPTCGWDWKEHELLLKQFEIKKEAFNSLLDSSGLIIKAAIESFELSYTKIINQKYNSLIMDLNPSIEYKKGLCKLSEEHISFFEILKNNYAKYKIDLSLFYTNSFDLNDSLKTDELEDVITNLCKPYSSDRVTPQLEDLFEAIFKNNVEELKKLKIESIESKVRYIQQKHSESRLQEIQDKRKIYTDEKNKLDKAIALDKNLKALFDLYNENVNEYISSISESIEILFHIYSGRLLQNFHNGLGVFIDTDGKSVTFKDSPNSSHDVIFSMSSGQLSSLVIAFTMALNHKYAKNKLLLIDDPVQTMDEINAAGFIDLLRHQFKDRQIFISTHEDHTSSYFRYKFSKAGLDQERINFNNLFKEELSKSLEMLD